jgi:glycopeptide antibiotics resistance protein
MVGVGSARDRQSRPASAPAVSAWPDSSAGDRRSLFVLDPGLPRFASVLLIYVVGLTALATLSPFDFFWGPPHGYTFETTYTDVALNLAFLFPAGFLLRLARSGRGAAYCLDALLFGAALSLVLELTQGFLPTRVTSPTDVATNALGAWAGAFAHSQLGPWLDRRLQKQLSLHLPLANLLYLAVPLLSLDALATSEPYEALVEIPLLLFMAWTAAGLYVHRLLGSSRPFAGYYSLAIGALFAIGYLPRCVHALQPWAALSLAAACATRVSIAIALRLPKTDRRFVPQTIRRALPWFVIYLVAASAYPWLASVLTFPAPTDADSVLGGAQGFALTLLRDVAAFTLLGYLVSELHARSPGSTGTIMLRVAVSGGLAAVVFIALRSVDGYIEPDWRRAGVLELGCLAGAVIHRSQLRLVRSWGRTVPPTAMPAS